MTLINLHFWVSSWCPWALHSFFRLIASFSGGRTASRCLVRILLLKWGQRAALSCFLCCVAWLRELDFRVPLFFHPFLLVPALSRDNGLSASWISVLFWSNPEVATSSRPVSAEPKVYLSSSATTRSWPSKSHWAPAASPSGHQCARSAADPRWNSTAAFLSIAL